MNPQDHRAPHGVRVERGKATPCVSVGRLPGGRVCARMISRAVLEIAAFAHRNVVPTSFGVPRSVHGTSRVRSRLPILRYGLRIRGPAKQNLDFFFLALINGDSLFGLPDSGKTEDPLETSKWEIGVVAAENVRGETSTVVSEFQ